MDTAFPWSCETNWIIAHGSLKDSVTVESSDEPIDENLARKSPLTLKPPGPDSGPCEFKICFRKKYEVGQIYVRSTARTYEIYCTHSAQTINEYLCTVRCGVAERDDKALQTDYIEDVVEKHREVQLEEVAAETATDVGNAVSSEDDWVNIKVAEDGRGSSASDKIITNGLNNIQDLYEATAQISDSDPCLSITIRLLSLQDKGYVYVDEIYVFVDPVESIDSGNEAVSVGSSAQSSLMAMFMPTLLQLSKSVTNRVPDRSAFGTDAKKENGSRVIDEVDSDQRYVKVKELDKGTAVLSEFKDTAESSELRQHTSAKQSVESRTITDPSPGRLETAFEQLIFRMNRVEKICLRFEEKMLKPIENVEARLQRVEDQLKKLTKNSHNIGLPNCTRISAPAFSCSESNSSSFYNEQSDYPPHGESAHEEKDSSCDNMPELSSNANYRPSLVVTAPEFSCGDGDDDNDDLKPLKDSPRIKPLAASFYGSASNPSEHIQSSLGLSKQLNDEKQDEGDSEHIQRSEEKKDFSCDNMPKLPSDANYHPSLVAAPEFPCGDGEEYIDDLKPLKDSPSIKPTKTLSLDEALAASLYGFLSTTASNPSEHIRSPLGLSNQVNDVNQDKGDSEHIQSSEKKDFSCDNMPKFSSDANYHPSVVVTAPEFSCDHCEEDNNDLKPVKDSPSIKPTKTLSLDEALAESLNGFLSTTANNPSEHIQLSLGLSNQENDENQDKGDADFCEIKAEESPDGENGDREPSRYAQVVADKAHDFTSEGTGNEEDQLNYTPSSVTENEKKDDRNEIVPSSTQHIGPFTSTDSCDSGRSESINELGSASNGGFPVLPVKASGTCLGESEGHLNGSSEVKVIESYFEGGSTDSSRAGIITSSAPDLAKEHQSASQTIPLGISTSFSTDGHHDNASAQVLEHKSEAALEALEQYVAFGKSFKSYAPNFSESSHAALLDLQFPILEVKFASDTQSSTKTPLEALLGGAAEPDTEVCPNNATSDDDVHKKHTNDVIADTNGTTDALPINYPLVDVGVLAVDGSSDMVSTFHTPSSTAELSVNLI